MAHACSKRSKQIVANARLVSHECGTVKAGSSSTAKVWNPSSPLPSWWDDIFEAHDLNVKLKKQRRKLFISPVKGAVAATTVNKISLSCDIVEAPPELRKHCDLVSHIGTVVCDGITDNCAVPLTSLQGIVEIRGPKNIQDASKLILIQGEHKKCAAINNVTNTQLLSTATLSCPSEFVANDNAYDPSCHDLASSSLECISDNSNAAAYKFPSYIRIEEAKLALNSGIEHTTPKGKVRKARSIRQSCLNSCKRCDHPRLTNMERLCLNEEFWGLKNHVEQWKFISKLTKVFSPKKKFVSIGTKGGKLSSRSYFFLINGQSRKVCKTMFKSTLCICDSWIDNAISHRSESGELQQDRRGKHMNRPKRGHK